MEDVELVLRFFAYRQKHRLHKGTSLSDYLDSYLRYGNAFSAVTLEELEKLFLETISVVEDTFGPKAFWLWRRRGKEASWTWLERPTQTVYDPLMFVIGANIQAADRLRKNAPAIQAELPAFYQSNYAVFEGRNVNPSALLDREQKFQEFIGEILSRP